MVGVSSLSLQFFHRWESLDVSINASNTTQLTFESEFSGSGANSLTRTGTVSGNTAAQFGWSEDQSAGTS